MASLQAVLGSLIHAETAAVVTRRNRTALSVREQVVGGEIVR
jgi:hypothetical protein